MMADTMSEVVQVKRGRMDPRWMDGGYPELTADLQAVNRRTGYLHPLTSWDRDGRPPGCAEALRDAGGNVDAAVAALGEREVDAGYDKHVKDTHNAREERK